jgi:DNA-binding NarL/FixJ family response regulator
MDVLEPAEDGASTLDRIENHRPDLVILDSSLPEDELGAMLRRIKEGWPDVRCIVIADSPRQQRAMEAAGADATLVEGFSPELLTAAIISSLGTIRRRRKNEASLGDLGTLTPITTSTTRMHQKEDP